MIAYCIDVSITEVSLSVYRTKDKRGNKYLALFTDNMGRLVIILYDGVPG